MNPPSPPSPFSKCLHHTTPHHHRPCRPTHNEKNVYFEIPPSGHLPPPPFPFLCVPVSTEYRLSFHSPPPPETRTLPFLFPPPPPLSRQQGLHTCGRYYTLPLPKRHEHLQKDTHTHTPHTSTLQSTPVLGAAGLGLSISPPKSERSSRIMARPQMQQKICTNATTKPAAQEMRKPPPNFSTYFLLQQKGTMPLQHKHTHTRAISLVKNDFGTASLNMELSAPPLPPPSLLSLPLPSCRVCRALERPHDNNTETYTPTHTPQQQAEKVENQNKRDTNRYPPKHLIFLLSRTQWAPTSMKPQKRHLLKTRTETPPPHPQPQPPLPLRPLAHRHQCLLRRWHQHRWRPGISRSTISHRPSSSSTCRVCSRSTRSRHRRRPCTSRLCWSGGRRCLRSTSGTTA